MRKPPKAVFFVVNRVSKGSMRGPYPVKQTCVAPDYCVRYTSEPLPSRSDAMARLERAISDAVRRERRRAVKIIRNHICTEDWCRTCTVNPGAIIANILRKSR